MRRRAPLPPTYIYGTAGLEGWGKWMEAIRKPVKQAVRSVSKGVVRVVKQVPKVVKKVSGGGSGNREVKPKTVVEQPAAVEIEPEPQLLPAPAPVEEPPDRTLLIAGSIVGAVAVGVAVWMIVRARRRG